MGKTQEDEGTRPVKREVVSASANLEVISEENFARRLQGMSACINCQKERYSGSSHSRYGGPRHHNNNNNSSSCLLYTSPSPRDCIVSRMPSSA